MSRLEARKKKGRSLDEIFNRANPFIRNISKKDRLVVIHDSDPDGVCSAAITIIALKRLGVTNVVGFASNPEHVSRDLRKIKGFSKVIIQDLAADLIKKNISQMKKSKSEFLIFDHHLVWKINARNIFYINPRLAKKELYMPTSYLVYKYFSKLADLHDVEWISVIGTVADYGIKDTLDLIGKYMRKKDYENIWQSEFGRAAIILNSSVSIIGAGNSLKVLLQLKNYSQFKKNNVFRKATGKFGIEFRKMEKEVLRRMEEHPKIRVRFSIVNPKYKRIGSSLSSKWGRKWKDSVLIIFEKSGSNYKIHGRSTSRVSVGDLFRKLKVGGGHFQSGGGMIKIKGLQTFKAALIKEIEKINRIKR